MSFLFFVNMKIKENPYAHSDAAIERAEAPFDRTHPLKGVADAFANGHWPKIDNRSAHQLAHHQLALLAIVGEENLQKTAPAEDTASAE